MQRIGAVVAACWALSVPACTDYDAEGGQAYRSPFLTSRGSSLSARAPTGSANDGGPSRADAGATDPFVSLDTWTPPEPADAGPTAADGLPTTPDASTRAPDGSTATPDSTTPGSDGVISRPDTSTQAPDGVISRPDTSTLDTSTQAPDGVISRPDTSWPDTSTQAPDGVISTPDTSTHAPDGVISTPDTSTPDTSTQAPDGVISRPDTSRPDTSTPDTSTHAPDGVISTPDTSTTTPDGVISSPDGRTPTPDILSDASRTADGDTLAPDTHAAGDAGDSAWYPDWQGYPDADFPPDADVFGGVINSCFSLYLYVVDETCSGSSLTPQCIDGAADDGSLYANFQFAPVRDCLKANCIDRCSGDPSGKKCFDKCLSKHCAYPFFACITAGQAGQNDCRTTLACLDAPQNKDKIITIANNCFGTAKASAQKQVADFFACGAEPQATPCFKEIAACYNAPHAVASCSATVGCAAVCEQQKKGEACVYECIGKGDAHAIELLEAVQQCQLDNCGDCKGPKGCGDACGGKYCAAQWAACQADK